MKIAFIVDTFPVLSETFILNQITGLIDRGYEVDIYAERIGDTTNTHPDVKEYDLLQKTYLLTKIPENILSRIVKGISLFVQHFPGKPLFLLNSLNVGKYGFSAVGLWLFYTAISIEAKTKYDIIHCQFGTQGNRGIFLSNVLSYRPKLVTTFRGHDISKYIQNKGKDIYQELFEVGDFFFTNCNFFKQRVIELGCDSNKINIHYSGLDCQKFSFSPRYAPQDGCIHIATTGRLVEKKGIADVILAVAKQAKSYPNLEYNIIGDGELKEQLQQLINQLEVDHIVHLLGWKNEREIIEILDKSHIFIAPSITAADGNQDAPINVLKEAMAMGLPVISTYHGGIPELVKDGISGFLVPEGDADAIAKKLNYLLSNPDTWVDMGYAGRAHVEKYFDIHQLNDKLVKTYQGLLVKESDFNQESLKVQVDSAIPLK